MCADLRDSEGHPSFADIDVQTNSLEIVESTLQCAELEYALERISFQFRSAC
jgi:hypothetical protein